MNARLPVWALGVVKIHLSLMDLVGQIVLNRDGIRQNSSAELCLCYKVGWTSPAAAGEKWLGFVGLHPSSRLWHTEKSNVSHLSAVLCRVGQVGHRIPYHSLLGREKQATLGDTECRCKRWLWNGARNRCVAFECVVALGKQGGVANEQFRHLKNHCQRFQKNWFY